MSSFIFTGELDSIPYELPFDYTIRIDKQGKLLQMRISRVLSQGILFRELPIRPNTLIEYDDENVRLTNL